MPDMTRESDQILSAAGKSLALQRDGGVHRRGSIGRGSAEIKRQHWKKKLGRILLAVGGIWVTSSIVGIVIGGLGFTGLMLAALAVFLATGTLSRFPRMKVPTRADLNKGDARQMVGRTELWLEAQRPALPPPAVKVVDQLGVQLDALGLQLETIDASHPSVNEVRELVGEYIPETIENYRKIPAHLRSEQHAGKTPDEQLTESLTRISGEVDRVTRRLAEGALDDLAIKSRYLEYRYGGTEALEDQSR